MWRHSTTDRIGNRLVATAALGTLVIAGEAACGATLNDRHQKRTTYVVFSRQQARGQNHDIYIADADGGNQRRLTSWRGDEQTPRFSPDGKKVVFRAASGPDIAPDIWVMNRDGSGKRNLTRTPMKTEWSPVWTRDGRHIIFSCESAQVGAVGNDLCIMNADRSERRYLLKDANGSEEYPSLDPAGRRFTYIYYGSGGIFQIWVAAADGSHRHRISSPTVAETWPSWSPDGHHIAFERIAGNDIWVMRPDGSAKRNLTRTPALDEQFPAWLPDGRLSFTRGRGTSESSYGLWVMNADGSGQKELMSHVSGWGDWTGAR